MKTRRNKGSDRENRVIPPIIASLHKIPTIYCNHCADLLPMYSSRVYIWKEDKDGRPYKVHVLHSQCQEPFVKLHKGKWFSKSMLAL